MFILTQSLEFSFFGLQGVNKAKGRWHEGGLDKIFKIRDLHHRTRRQILRQNVSQILIGASF